MFPDRKRVPGRKTKYILAIVYLIHIYVVSKFLYLKRNYGYNSCHLETRQNSRNKFSER